MDTTRVGLRETRSRLFAGWMDSAVRCRPASPAQACCPSRLLTDDDPVCFYLIMVDQPQIVFVPGLFSSPEIWNGLVSLLQEDSSLSGVDFLRFKYTTQKVELRPWRKIPDFDDLADQLRTYINTRCDTRRPVMIVSHSQGGLIVQRFLARSLQQELYDDIRGINKIVMFSCPNSGSDIFLSLRRVAIVWRHTQERELRPLNRLVSETRSIVLRRIIGAPQDDPSSCYVPMHFYAGDTDNVVTSVSALDVFPPANTGVIRGDHSSIIQPQGTDDDTYVVVRTHIDQVIQTSEKSTDRTAPALPIAATPGESLNVPDLVQRASTYAAEGLNSQAEATYQQAAATGDIRALQEYSRFQRRQGHLTESIVTSSRVIEILVNSDDSADNRVRRSHVMSTIGISQRKLGKLLQSEKSLREAVLSAQGDTVAESKARAYALDNLGITLMRGADMAAARRSFQEALSVRETLDDNSGLAQTLMNIARLELREGGLDAAAEACDNALRLLDKDKDKAGVASALSIRGEVEYAKPDLHAAEDAFNEALELNTSTGRSVSIALSQQQLARTLLVKGDTVGAEMHARRSLTNFTSASNMEGEVSSRQLLGRIANANGAPEEAVAVLEECVMTYRRLGNLTGEAWSSFYLAEVLYQLDRPDAGAARLQRAAGIADSINNASLRRAVDAFQHG